MTKPALFASFLLLFTSSYALAQQETGPQLPAAELAVSDETLQVRYLARGERINVEQGQLHAGIFLSEERDFVGTIGLLVPGNLDFGRLHILFGPQAYAALLEDENSDVMALSIGLEARYDLDRTRGLAIAGHAYIAPDILTFGAADRVTDLGARAELRVTSNIVGFAGMRWFEMDLTEGRGERTLQEELIAGVRWEFE